MIDLLQGPGFLGTPAAAPVIDHCVVGEGGSK
jgi:hypothetical protein